jgi:hypothetical protein
MNNNFDELILKRRARVRARTASMGAHVSWGVKGGRERLGGANVGARGLWGAWGHELRGAWAMGAHSRGARTPEGTHARRRPSAVGALGRARPRPRGAYVRAPHWKRVRPRATWLVEARTYAPSNGGAHASCEEGINGVTLLISRCQVFSSLLLA